MYVASFNSYDFLKLLALFIIIVASSHSVLSVFYLMRLIYHDPFSEITLINYSTYEVYDGKVVFRANGFSLTGIVTLVRRNDTILKVLSPRLVATWLRSKPSSFTASLPSRSLIFLFFFNLSMAR